jgi:pimeloyl-ACP methyl ester carboxylesterase
MGKKRAALLVGLMGGSLYDTSGPQDDEHRQWVNFSALAAEGLGSMRLGFDGESAGAPEGLELLPGGPDDRVLGGYYDDGVKDLRDNAPDDSWEVQALPYDWRKDEVLQAAIVANNIIAGVEQEGVESWTLCGHSQGGIISILAYANLAARGKASYIRRIVTICSPLYGLWCCPLTLAGVSPQLVQVARFQQFCRTPLIAKQDAPALFLAKLCANWPAFYQLFPSQLSRKPSDSDRFVYAYETQSYYKGNAVHGLWLGNALQFNVLLEDAIQSIPPSVLVSIASKGIETPWNSNINNYVPGMKYQGPYASGDGTVVYEDQFSALFDHFDVDGWVHSESWNLAGRSDLLSALAYRWQQGQPLSGYDVQYRDSPRPVLPWPDLAIFLDSGQTAQNSKLGYQPSAKAVYHDP